MNTRLKQILFGVVPHVLIVLAFIIAFFGVYGDAFAKDGTLGPVSSGSAEIVFIKHDIPQINEETNQLENPDLFTQTELDDGTILVESK